MYVQGFVLGQFGLLYALEHEEQIDRLFILNTPLSLKSKLRPELAAYKSPVPFLRPGNVSSRREQFRIGGKAGAAAVEGVCGA